jgi:hypothetical protein
VRNIGFKASRVAQWSKALYCSARGVTIDPGLIPGCVAAGRRSGRPMRRRTIGPVSSGLGEGLAGRDDLAPLRSSDSL